MAFNIPRISALLSYPIFWPAKDIISFIKSVSDYLQTQRIEKDSDLAGNSNRIFDGTWTYHLSNEVSFHLHSQSKRHKAIYDGNDVLKLLRFIRNTSDHYWDLPVKTREELGDLPHDFMKYWLTKFPLLLPILYTYSQKWIAKQSPTLNNFFVRGYDEQPEFPFYGDEYHEVLKIIIDGIRQYITTGGLVKRYQISHSGGTTSCNLSFLKMPPGILPCVFSQAIVTVRVHNEELTVRSAVMSQNAPQNLLQCSINLEESITICLFTNTFTDFKWNSDSAVLETLQTFIFTTTTDSSMIDSIIQSSFQNEIEYELKPVSLKWSELDKSYQKLLLGRTVICQGCQVKLQDVLKLVADNEESMLNTLNNFMSGELLHNLIEDKKPTILNRHHSVSRTLPYHIDRKLLPRNFITLDKTQEVSKKVFAITSVDESTFSRITGSKCPMMRTISSRRAIVEKRISCSHNIILEDNSHFKLLVNKTPYPVYLFRFHGSYLKWLKSSTRSIDWIQSNHCKYVTSELQCIEELNIEAAYNENLPIIVSDAPGMGKSVLLESWANMLIRNWPTRIVKLYPFTKFLTLFERKIEETGLMINYERVEIPVELIKKCAVQMLCEEKEAEGSFSNSLMESLLIPYNKPRIKVELMLDGLDELVSSQLQFARKILEVINQHLKSIRLWISTRRQHLNKIEYQFSTMGYLIAPFDKEDQLNFLVKFWCYKNKVLSSEQQDKLRVFAKSCLDTAPSDYLDILGIPLQCRLLAEVHQVHVKTMMEESSSEVVPPVLTPIVSVLDLYEKVVEAKLEIYITKPYNPHDESNPTTYQRNSYVTKQIRERMNKIHIKKALELLVPVKWVECFKGNYLAHDEPEIDEVFAFGIIESKHTDDGIAGEAAFIHRTLAEYYVAFFVVQMLTSNTISSELLNNACEFLVQEILKTEDYKEPFQDEGDFEDGMVLTVIPHKTLVHGEVILKFLELMLSKLGKELSLNVYSAICQCLNCELWVEKLGECLHALIKARKLHITQLLATSLKQDAQKLGEFVESSNESGKLGEMICSAVRTSNIELLKYVFNMTEESGILIAKVNYFKNKFWGFHNIKKVSSSLEPLNNAVTNDLSYEIIHYLVIEKGLSYSPKRMKDFGSYGILHCCIHQLTKDFVIGNKPKSYLDEGIKVIKLLVTQNKDILEERSRFLENIPGSMNMGGGGCEDALFTPLIYAAAIGAPVEIFKCLIELGADVNAVEVKMCSRTFMHHVACRQSMPRKFRDIPGYTPEEFHKIAELAFTFGFDPSSRCTPLDPHFREAPSNQTFLHDVVSYYPNLLPDTIQLFKRHNLDFNAVNDFGESILKLAITHSATLMLIDDLIQGGARLECDARGKNALHWAASVGIVGAVQYFVSVHQIGVNTRCKLGFTPLHYAVSWDKHDKNPEYSNFRLQIATYLINEGADVNAVNLEGDLPFMIPFKSNSGIPNLQILELLKEKNADITPEMCNAAIMYIFKKGLSEFELYGGTLLSVLKFLKAHGGDANLRLEEGKTLLHAACEKLWLEGVKWLVEECGLNVNAVDNKGQLPRGCLQNNESTMFMLHTEKRCEIERYLIDNGCI
ncbi:unnamed protein product [Orchesella dallaii]|uniref:KEN domain-containing protein n=1 Tax=Orchesella dallaii TaxID=48710 RepID=A0ABP1RAL9_9HEXA